MNDLEARKSLILGQKYAFATASLILGITCFTNLLGLEKAILAIVFARLALRAKPEPVLKEHRLWAKAGMILGILPLIILPILILLNLDQIRELIEMLSKLNGGR
ncbi:MAG TPA: hypothetical protein VJ023_07080 [Pyrinomonadaceae bacterium]|nr:hypothetical protein [Pyrinomonadaceae bacterium]